MPKEKLIKIIQEILTEVYSIDERETLQDLLLGMPYEILNDVANQEKILFRLIPKNPYHTALREFIKYGRFMRFPDKLIYKWKSLLLENIAKLNTLTEIHGHSTNFPFDEFYDIFDSNEETGESEGGEFSKWLKTKYKETGEEDYLKKYNWNTAYEFLDEIYNIDDITPQFSSGHHVLSDYATEPLLKLGLELEEKKTPEEIIVVINKILDVTHQRSDIAEIFIEGGTDSLEYITHG